MGLFKNENKRNAFDTIRCDEPSYLIWKWKSNNRENTIRWGSSLRVKDGEVAVFVYNLGGGICQDYIEGPCDQVLQTLNFPVLSSIIGSAYGGGSPFQAEVYFINLAKIIQVRFAVPYFDVFDPRFSDYCVPVAVRGTISFSIKDYVEFIKLHRLDRFDLDDFQKQIRDAVSRYVKDIVTNAPAENNIPVIQIESKVGQINDVVEYAIAQRFSEQFGVDVTGVDIGVIEIDKTSDGYNTLMAITKDVTAATVMAQAAAGIKNIHDKQRIEAEDYQEKLRIEREESQYNKHKQTQTENIAAFQIEKQAEVGVAGAEALGQMGSNGSGSVSMGDGSGSLGFNPASMMASMAVAGAVGQNIAGTMNGILSQSTQQSTTPPPIPQDVYYVADKGQPVGPFDVSTLSQMIKTGKLTSKSLVWKEGMTEWDQAGSIERLRHLFSISQIPPIPVDNDSI